MSISTQRKIALFFWTMTAKLKREFFRHCMPRARFGFISVVTLSFFASISTVAFANAFPDVAENRPSFQAITYLKENGIVGGYDDGTFKPEKSINRAELLKILVGGTGTQPTVEEYARCFPDVNDEWFAPYVCYAKEKGWVGGYPDGTFQPANTVTKMEAIKMLVLAQEMDPGSYSEIKLALSDDVQNPDEWYYPYLRLAISASMTMISQQGTLNPGAQLNREQVSMLLFRLLMYKEGRRTQALLSEAENEILIILAMLETDNISQAEYASARALIAARGAHTSRPDDVTVQGALKITESFRTLVRAYRSGIGNDLDEVIRLAGEAWNLADRAKQINPDVSELANQVQTIASQMADSARASQ